MTYYLFHALLTFGIILAIYAVADAIRNAK